MSIERKYIKNCPYCGKTSVQRLLVNIICSCGAKYYFAKHEWLQREQPKGYESMIFVEPTYGAEKLEEKIVNIKIEEHK